MNYTAAPAAATADDDNVFYDWESGDKNCTLQHI